jgi:hypothetical protein
MAFPVVVLPHPDYLPLLDAESHAVYCFDILLFLGYEALDESPSYGEPHLQILDTQNIVGHLDHLGLTKWHAA